MAPHIDEVLPTSLMSNLGIIRKYLSCWEQFHTCLDSLWFIILALEAMFDECVFTQPSDGSLCAYICIYSMYLDKIET